MVQAAARLTLAEHYIKAARACFYRIFKLLAFTKLERTMALSLTVALSSLLAAIVLVAIVLLKKYHALAVVRKLPGPKPNFLFGNALQLARLPDGKYKVLILFLTSLV